MPLAVKITVVMGHATYPATISDSFLCGLDIKVLAPHLSCRCIHHAFTFNTCKMSHIYIQRTL